MVCGSESLFEIFEPAKSKSFGTKVLCQVRVSRLHMNSQACSFLTIVVCTVMLVIFSFHKRTLLPKGQEAQDSNPRPQTRLKGLNQWAIFASFTSCVFALLSFLL